MRSVAVLTVVYAHMMVYIGHPTYGGWSGITAVCFFFVHTSLVLMFSLERDPDVGRFYVRRAFRIYPLWLVMVAVITLFHLAQFPPDFQYRWPGFHSFLANVLLIFNLFPHLEIVGAGWTLPIEVDMYLFLPALFFFARSVKSVWPLLVLDLFVMLFNLQFFPAVSSILPMCIPCFLPGVMAYTLWKRSRRPLPGWLFPVFLFTLLAVNQVFGNWRRNWFSCLALGLALPFFRELEWQPLKRAAHTVAKYSYGIYLTHITALMVFAHVLRGEPMILRLFALAFLLVVPPFALYHLVEAPMIRLGSNLSRSRRDRISPRTTDQMLSAEPVP